MQPDKGRALIGLPTPPDTTVPDQAAIAAMDEEEAAAQLRRLIILVEVEDGGSVFLPVPSPKDMFFSMEEAACLLPDAFHGQTITILCDLDAVYPSAPKKYAVQFLIPEKTRVKFGAGWHFFAEAHDLRAGDTLCLERVKDRVDTQGNPRPTLAARVIFGPDTAPKGSFSITTTLQHKTGGVGLSIRAMDTLFPGIDPGRRVNVQVLTPGQPGGAETSSTVELKHQRNEFGNSTGGRLGLGWKEVATAINLKACKILKLTRVEGRLDGNGAPMLCVRAEMMP